MARRSLRPHLNQIRAWVRQGRTDAWVAHQLDVTVQEIEQFKRQNELPGTEDVAEGQTAVDYDEEIDLRAEDDALIAAELEAAARETEREEAEARARAQAEEAERAARTERRNEDANEGEESDGEGSEGDGEAPRTRRRGRRGGRSRRSTSRDSRPLEGTFDHGEEGYGLWLDPAIQDNAIYAEHWAGHRPVEVIVEEDQIVIRRVGEEE